LEKIYGIETKVVDFKWYTNKIFSLQLYSPKICQNSKPGHFVMVRNRNWNLNPFLSRPMSIAKIDKESNILELQILVAGKGTELLSQLTKKDKIQIIGPLGNYFSVPEDDDSIALIAGGIGVAPLVFLESILKQKHRNIEFFYGAANESELIPKEYLQENIRFSTDDGSKGFDGFVTQDFVNYLTDNKVQKIYACGPNPMLKVVQDIALKNDIFCELSIETIMACGMGICQGCIVPKKENKNEFYLTCVDGPVFNAKNISLD